LVAALLLSAGPACADVSFTEHTVGTAGKHSAESETTISIKASRVRIETKDGGEIVAAIYDIDNGRQIILRSKQKEAAVSDFTEQSAEVENKKFAPETTFAPTGKNKDILGKTCSEYSFSIRVPVFEELAVDLLVTGSVFVMRGTPESKEFADFVRRAQRQNLIWGLSSDNAGAIALARAQTELYQQVAAIGGIPLETDEDIQFQGGYWSKAFVKGDSGDKTSTVTAISSDPLPDAQFMVPHGWKIHTQ
jgi:hypothetical protein